MIQLPEVKMDVPIEIPNGLLSTTTKVWELLTAARDGNLQRVREIIDDCPDMAYAQYNYTPPIHFAVCQGHTELTKYLLELGALSSAHITYPFGDTLLTMAEDRGYNEIARLLREYLADPGRVRFKGDCGKRHFDRPDIQIEFERAIDHGELTVVKKILDDHPEFALDETAFWGEGVLMMPAHDNRIDLIELLMSYGARVPLVSKWAREYYFKNDEAAKFLLENGMNPDHMSWRHVTLLHNMAHAGDISKATLLLDHGASINPIDEEYLSTPLGFAARWGRTEMVAFLLERGADVNKSGAPWSTPLAWARKKNHKEIEEMLLQAGAE